MEALFVSDHFWKIITVIVLGAYGLLKAKYFAFDKPKDANKKKLVEIGEIAVKETFDEYVRELRRGKEGDGKLDKEEIKKANDMAIAKIKEKAKEKGIEIGKILAEEYLPVLVDKIVKKNKGK